MAFHEHWFNPAKQRRLKEAMAMVSAPSGAVVEVGCWEGRSTIEIANHFWPEPVHCVDHWRGDLTNLTNGVAALAAGRDVHADFLANMTEHTKGNFRVHRDDWRAVFAEWSAPIRFIFIDGQHTYAEVYDNIVAAQPFMVPGGVIAGDDLTLREVYRAVRAALGEVTSFSGPGAAVWWTVMTEEAMA